MSDSEAPPSDDLPVVTPGRRGSRLSVLVSEPAGAAFNSSHRDESDSHDHRLGWWQAAACQCGQADSDPAQAPGPAPAADDINTMSFICADSRVVKDIVFMSRRESSKL